MSGAKHTPEWRWERAGCRVYSAEFHRGRPVKIADVGIGGAVDEAELEARGRLIASAPDLLEAATEALDSELRRKEAGETYVVSVIHLLSAAIAKATGADQ